MRIVPGEDERGLIYGITDASLSCGRNNVEVAKAMLEGGVRVIQYREKYRDKGIMLEECRKIRRLCNEFEACLIVNDHVDIALLCGADGVHIGQSDLPVWDVRTLVWDSMFIGVSARTSDEVLQAAKDGADCVGIGPIYTTATKADAGKGIMFETLDWCAKSSPLPFCAIGGINRTTIGEVASHGCKSFAIVSDLVSAPDIALRAKELFQLAQQ